MRQKTTVGCNSEEFITGGMSKQLGANRAPLFLSLLVRITYRLTGCLVFRYSIDNFAVDDIGDKLLARKVK